MSVDSARRHGSSVHEPVSDTLNIHGCSAFGLADLC
jgi:hypothetical protein